MSRSPTISEAALSLSRDLRVSERARYLATLTAPAAKRSGLWGLLALGRELDRIPGSVSEPMLGRIKLQWWIDAVPGIVEGPPPSHPAALALAEHGEALRPHADTLIAWTQAREAALEGLGETDMEAYALATGGETHRLMLAVLGVEDAAASQAARHVGTAWALLDLMAQRHDSREVLARLACDHLDRARALSVPGTALPVLLSARMLDGRIRRARAGRDIPPAGLGAFLSILWGAQVGRY